MHYKNRYVLLLFFLCSILALAGGCSLSVIEPGGMETIAYEEITKEEYEAIIAAYDAITAPEGAEAFDYDQTDVVTYGKIFFEGVEEGCPVRLGIVFPSASTEWYDLIDEGICYFAEDMTAGWYRYDYVNTGGFSDLVTDYKRPAGYDGELEPVIMVMVASSVDKTHRLTGKTERLVSHITSFWYPHHPNSAGE